MQFSKSLFLDVIDTDRMLAGLRGAVTEGLEQVVRVRHTPPELDAKAASKYVIPRHERDKWVSVYRRTLAPDTKRALRTLWQKLHAAERHLLRHTDKEWWIGVRLIEIVTLPASDNDANFRFVLECVATVPYHHNLTDNRDELPKLRAQWIVGHFDFLLGGVALADQRRLVLPSRTYERVIERFVANAKFQRDLI